MASHREVAARYWGYLIKPDKRPSPVLEQLLLSIAKYINRHVAPWDEECLTPAKLSHFYRLVGGDYDALFLDTPKHSLSFIYRSLGCYHTLQPEKDAHAAPSIPALTCSGFVRWQTVQLLLDPDEHVPFLQNAVKRFDLVNPTDGEAFPALLNREALPLKSDPEMVAWYASVSERLMVEVQASQGLSLPQRPPMPALSDNDTQTSRPTSADSFSIETQSLVDAASFFQLPQRRTNVPPPGPPKSVRPATLGSVRPKPLPRRSSYPGPPHSAQSSRRQSYNFQTPLSPPRTKSHTRTSSTLSTTSCSSDCSSVTTSSASSDCPAYPPRRVPSLPQSRNNILVGQRGPLQRLSSHSEFPSSWHNLRTTSRRETLKPGAPSPRYQDQRSQSVYRPSRLTTKHVKDIASSSHEHDSKPGLSRAKTVGAKPLYESHPRYGNGAKAFGNRRESRHR